MAIGIARNAQVRAELEALYRRSYDRFLRVAIAILHDETAAHDSVQDAFARALKHLKRFDGKGELEAWVWRIVVNAALAARKGRRGVRLEPQLVAEPGAESDREVRGRIARLPERQRLIVFLRYYADLDYRAIAQALEIEVGTVSATLSAAHTTLRRELKEVTR